MTSEEGSQNLAQGPMADGDDDESAEPAEKGIPGGTRNDDSRSGCFAATDCATVIGATPSFLDGIRGLAILPVMFINDGSGAARSSLELVAQHIDVGLHGVDLFFVCPGS